MYVCIHVYGVCVCVYVSMPFLCKKTTRHLLITPESRVAIVVSVIPVAGDCSDGRVRLEDLDLLLFVEEEGGGKEERLLCDRKRTKH